MSKSKALNMLSKFSALAFAILGLASVLIGIVKADNPVSKELTQVITGIDLLDASDTKQNVSSEGDFSLRTNLAYKLRVTFDLKQYNEHLNNGDYFTFDIPAPMAVYEGSQDLIDPTTKVTIGEAEVTSNGTDQGGKAKITLKNLDKYLEKTGGDKVKDVSGNFSVTFRFLKDQNKTRINFNSSSLKQEVTHIYSSKTIDGPKVGTENYAKIGGRAALENWNSPKLAEIGSVSKGDAWSTWRVRVNTEKQDLGQNIVLHDTIPNDDTSYTPAQYIPETLKVYKANITVGTSAVPDDAVLLTEGQDYTVSWNENYTSFDIIFKDGTTSYIVSYNTTTPNDGSKVGNRVALSLADGTKLAQNTSRPGALDMTAEATSLISGTIVASTAYQIKIHKTDAFTLAPVSGAVYTVTAADDASETTEVTTNEKGVALTKTYDQKWEGKTFKIKEKTAPAGYKLDEKEYTVKLGAAGSTIHLKDEPVPAVFNVTAKKVVEGRTDKLPKADEFTFNLFTAENLKDPVATAKSKADGTITFENLQVKGAGTYHYIIKEDTSTAVAGVAFDTEAKEVTVAATFQSGVLTATVTSAEPTFTNTYKATPAKETITAKKVLNGKDLEADKYEFELKEGDKVVATAKNAADGTVTFKEIELETAGEYTYTITEKAGSEKGVTYDTAKHEVKVKVTDNGQGQLVATVTGNNPTFTNTYKAAKTSATITAKKVLEGKALEADKYEFELKEGDKVVATAKNAADGTVTFKEIEYNEAGDHTYTISEKAGSEAGVTYDTATHEVTVNVTDNGQGQLEAAVAGNNPTFTNTYKAAPAKIAIEAKKVLNGKELEIDEFEFELKEGDKVVATAKNAAGGLIRFSEISYSKAGVYNYTITEKVGNKLGVTYDKTEHPATVEVKDNGSGQLVATVTSETPVFVNDYKAEPAQATIKAKKVLKGKALEADAYTFELKEGSDLVATAKNTASGEVVFNVTFSAAGDYAYTITEKAGDDKTITYDQTAYEVFVTVADDGKGQLVATVEDADTERVFTNIYTAPAPTATSATLEFTKELTGRTLVDGEFQFELYKDGQKIDTKTNQGGKVTFNTINYDAEGVHTYTVKEVNAGATGITYDTEKTAKVTVTKDAATNALKAAVEYPAGNVFKNSFKAPAVEATIEATKKLEGKELAADAYTFELKEKGAVVATAKNTAEGKVAFVRSFEEAGTYTYTLVEKVGTEEGIEYDKTEHTVTVTVVADDQGLLTARVSYADGKEVVFTNKYTVPTPTPEPNPNPAPNNPGTTPDPAPTPDPTPNNPGTNPTPGTEPTGPGQKEDPKPAPPATETKGKAELPNTGEATSILSALGFVVLALSGLVFFVKRKA
ncbi:T surface-antigen of pili [Streptococcus sp. BCA20]|uniref:Spy0128 family protein n=1 Tax=Streptococcus TaxID=1301 RepID=UPI000280DEF9|nr:MULTISPECIES: FctA domain-containing protein [Streptococcus]RSJ39289.1 T surface-antigen of pili [Streptococcus sp. BCA20]EKA10625.1 cell wall surface anchor family protein [Streptococcus sp. GMD4S]MCP9124715.1 SpaA isopeptide-forming pilin-related protein [Streptococcus oralis]MCY7086930.1 LPXTG cell wall anchor domain-containing protein [Streptococcus oralis]RSH98333.1 T surface-antigen of pili [Streptococcus oralis]